MNTGIHQAGRFVLWLEPLLLGIVGFFFWYPTPSRTDWLWTLLLLVPVILARYLLHGRLLTRTPLDVFFAALLLLGVLNVIIAPYTRGLMLLARPFLGMLIYYAIVEKARHEGTLRGPHQAAVMLGLLLGLLAIGSTQWGGKSAFFQTAIDVLPSLRGFPGAEGGFNPNEIAGAMSWMTPLMAGFLLLRWQQKERYWDVLLAFILLFFALILGQSRSAIIGVLLALPLIITLLLRPGLQRWIAWIGLTILFVFMILLVLNLLQTDFLRDELSDVNEGQQTAVERSASVRFDIWHSALSIVRDYPLTGVGLSMFRDGRVRTAYPVPSVERILPHAHNEYLQVATDMGLPGLVVFLGIYVMAGWMAWRIWQRGDKAARTQALAVSGGLLAHAIFGLGDAITLWDRFYFFLWLLLGLLAAQYVLIESS